MRQPRNRHLRTCRQSRVLFYRCSWRSTRSRENGRERVAMPVQILLDHFRHERTAHAWREGFNFFIREPHSAFDAGIEFTLGIVGERLREKACAVISDVVARRSVEADADETLNVYGPTR